MRATVLAWWAVGLVACQDPVREALITSLGKEDPAIPQGPLHRAGQPCLACHDGNGEARAFAFAGTVYRNEDGDVPAAGVRVEAIDATGARYEVASNCAGNFFALPEDFTPTYPLWFALARGEYRIEMDSPVQRDGSCASCHQQKKGPSSTGRVYLYSAGEAGSDPAELECP